MARDDLNDYVDPVPEKDSSERLSAYQARLQAWCTEPRTRIRRLIRMTRAAAAQAEVESSSSDAVQVLQGWLERIEDEAIHMEKEQP